MAEYLFAVQTESGHEVVSAVINVDKVGDVHAFHQPEHDTVSIVNGDDQVASGSTTASTADLFLHRWPADDKLAKPVTHGVSR